jgi:hypothetical protein
MYLKLTQKHFSTLPRDDVEDRQSALGVFRLENVSFIMNIDARQWKAFCSPEKYLKNVHNNSRGGKR